MIRRILYSSRAAEGIGMRDVYDIIRVSHNRNSEAGLTGGLIFLDGHFYQLIEGLPSALQERYDRIQSDPRHHDLLIRQDITVDEPMFPSDWMALRDGSEIDRQVLQDHRYQPGMPSQQFNEEQLLHLLMACFDKELAESRPQGE